MSAAEIVARFAGLRALVVGEAMLDTYLCGEAGRICPEAPVPAVAIRERLDAPGGAANTAANVRALGGAVTLLSAAGDDYEGELLRQALCEAGIGDEQVLCVAGRRTLARGRVVAAGQLLVRFDQGDEDALPEAIERALVERLRALAPRHDVLIVSDYGYGVLSERLIAALAALPRASRPLLLVDAKRPERFRSSVPDLVKPNRAQAAALLGLDGLEPACLAARGEELLELTGARVAAVTLDADGAVTIERGRPPRRIFGRRVAGAQPAGAGDTVLATLALALAAGAETDAALELAVAAGGIAVSRPGTAACSARELLAELLAPAKFAATTEELAAWVATLRASGRRIVFTNGCFDLLHSGHVSYLAQARALGDVLVVGLNTDESVRRLKGPARPIVPLEDRIAVLSALRSVDLIAAFAEETPAELIRAVRPDVFVKGGDYSRERLPEAALVEELGGAVTILPYLSERSTSAIVERILRGADDGAAAIEARRNGAAAHTG